MKTKRLHQGQAGLQVIPAAVQGHQSEHDRGVPKVFKDWNRGAQTTD